MAGQETAFKEEEEDNEDESDIFEPQIDIKTEASLKLEPDEGKRLCYCLFIPGP